MVPLNRLRHRVCAVEQENRHLPLGLPPDIHSPLEAGSRLFPLHLPRRDHNPLALPSVAILNQKGIASIVVPW